jgi:uncharacterized membrane protein
MEIIVLRLLHIFTGVFWAGAVMLMAFLITPAAADAGPHGGHFMQKLMARKMPIWMMVNAIVNILTGFRLMWLDSGWNSVWFQQPMGMALTIGGVAAILAIVVGMAINMPVSKRMAAMAKQIGDNPPSAEQGAEVVRLRNKLAQGNNIIVTLLSITVILMAIARYLPSVMS